MQRRHWFLSAAFVSLTLGSLAACNGDDDDPVAVDAGATDAAADHATTHDTGAPQADANVADTNVPDTNVNAPDTNVADTNAPDANVADTNVPDTNVPDSNVADTNVPDTNVPDTNVPDTNVPDTNVPDTSAADASDAGAADASETGPSNACLSGDAGYAIVPETWNFTVASTSQNGGKGQLITIKRCDTVIWTNTDVGISHSIVSTGSGFAFSTAVNTGGPYAPIQFPTAGKFTYECGIHGAAMVGEITVQ